MRSSFVPRLGLFIVIACLSGCTTKVYTNPHGAGLGDLLNKATQDDVAKSYGPPTSTQKLSEGGEVWAYDYRNKTTAATTEGVTSATQCVRVIFIFGTDKVLHDYRRDSC